MRKAAADGLNRRFVPVLQTEDQYLFATASYCIIEVVQDDAGSKKLGDDVCLLGFTLNALAS